MYNLYIIVLTHKLAVKSLVGHNIKTDYKKAKCSWSTSNSLYSVNSPPSNPKFSMMPYTKPKSMKTTVLCEHQTELM